jgi:hypothetical protein
VLLDIAEKMKKTVSLALVPFALAVAACDSMEVTNPARPTPISTSAPADPLSPRTEYPGTGAEVVQWVASRFPDRLAAGVSDAERVANMEFLRDQIIETGICGGLDLARNLKRGVGPHSIDAIAWRHEDGALDVVDIARAYDDTGRPLELHWIIVGGPAGWDPVPPPACQ